MFELVEFVVMEISPEKIIRSFPLAVLTLLVSVAYLAVFSAPMAMASVQGFPSTSLKIVGTPVVENARPVTLSAEVEDPDGVEEVRFYFRNNPQDPYLFVRAEQKNKVTFQAVLPPFSAEIRQLEYFVLVVTSSQKVVRSSSVMTGLPGGIVQQPQSPEGGGIFHLYSELPAVPELGHLFLEPARVTIETVSRSEMFGLTGGVYGPDDFAGYEILEGYFGGYILSEIDGSPLPVKGILPGPSMGTALAGSSAPSAGNSPTMDAMTIVGPEIAGDGWSGSFLVYEYFAGCSCYVAFFNQPLTATVTQSSYQPPYYDWVTITTSRPSLGHYLAGPMGADGSMLIYDQYDGEDWSTHFGPATSTSIYIYDYVEKPSEENPRPNLNAIKITRTAPKKEPETNTGYLPGILHLLIGK